MLNILITGAAGQVGRELIARQDDFPGMTFFPAGRATLDITDPEAADRFLELHSIDYCINCAAYTAVDKAEAEPETARRVNVEGAAMLARACARHGTALIHLSSDYVYHNSLNRPLLEDDPTTPRGTYARTKLEGDRKVTELHPQSVIVRTSWIYAPFGKNFVTTMLQLGREREEIRVVYDQIGTPTYAQDLALALLHMIERREEGSIKKGEWPGIYHYANEGVTSWYDFAASIFEQCCINCRVHPIESKDFLTPAERPPFSLLNKRKIKNTFGLQIPHWRKSLQDCLERLARTNI